MTASDAFARAAAALAAALLLCVAGPAAAAELSRGERVSFESQGGDKATVVGYLALPAGRAAPLPAVVLVHGSGGLSEPREGHYLKALEEAGFAALAIDSFGPRGVASTVEDQSRVGTMQMVQDARAALRYLAQRPEIDAKRIAIAGFSKGGSVALLAADQRQAVDGLSFRAAVPFYPGCTTTYRHPKPTGPMLFLIGERDDYTTVKHCLPAIESLKAAGGDVRLVTYPDAHHAFDGDTSNLRWIRIPTAANFSRCDVVIEDGGAFTFQGQPLEANFAKQMAGCVTRGATVGANPDAKTKATAEFVRFLQGPALN